MKVIQETRCVFIFMASFVNANGQLRF